MLVKSTPPNSVVVGVSGQIVMREYALQIPGKQADLEHGHLPDTISEPLARLIVHIESLEKRVQGHQDSPNLHTPEHGVSHSDDFSI